MFISIDLKKKAKHSPQILPLTLNRYSFMFLGLELYYMVIFDSQEVKLGRLLVANCVCV